MIKLYNTLTGNKEPLVPLAEGHIKIYACGVTVYDTSHVGHAMQALVFDLLVRFLSHVGYRVTYVRNFTDVDDKIIARASELAISPRKLAMSIIDSCRDDFARLGLTPATHEPCVSQNIPEIIAMIEQLIVDGFAYASEQGNVYFRVSKFPNYGQLSNQTVEQLPGGDSPADDKEDPHDFALWKKSEVVDASWPSRWGTGRPGWHIECSAMAKKHLGVSFDIHGGGRDLVFPHHENEIAQSVAANNSSYATIWMHNGLVTVDGQKMAKSLGNHITIKDFLDSWPAEVLRLAIITHHYRSDIDFSEEIFRNNCQRLLYFYETLQFLEKNLPTDSQPLSNDSLAEDEHYQKLIVALEDDLNTPIALAELQVLSKKINGMRNRIDRQQFAKLHKVMLAFGNVFGLFNEQPQTFIANLKQRALVANNIDGQHIETLIEQRRLARQNKDYVKADQIRQQLADQGIDVRDSREGTEWSFILGY